MARNVISREAKKGLAAVWPWEGDLVLLSHGFLICKRIVRTQTPAGLDEFTSAEFSLMVVLYLGKGTAGGHSEETSEL